MEVEIIPINLGNDLFEDYSDELHKLQSQKYCYITNLDFISKLLITEMPIKNKRLAIKNILEFLTFIDIQMKIYNTSLLPISTKVIISHLHRDNYKSYLQILKDNNIITDVPYEDGLFYTKGEKSKQYRVHNDYLNNDNLCIVVLANDRAKDRFTCDIEDLDDRFVSTIKNLQINLKDAIIDEINYCKENNLSSDNLRIRISRIFYTRMKRFIKKGKNVNRVYHSFTNVSKVARRHLNMKLYNIDIANCQPLLLVSYLKENDFEYDESYQYNVENNLFYDDFITDKLSRDNVKELLYKNVFFGFFENNKINKRFRELYPITWESIKEIQLTGISLASRLQNLEAELFNNLIPQKSKNYFTLFDAIYFDNVNDIVKLNDTIIDFFREKEVKVTTKIEY